MATRHTSSPFPASILIALSLALGCGGQSEGDGSSGGSSGGGGRPSATGGSSSGGAPSNGGTTAGGSAQGGASDGCVYGGKTYRVGEMFRDDCNTCTCYSGNLVGCTLIACPPDTCDVAESSFTAAIASAKVCDPEVYSEQCTLYETSDLNCGCPTYVNPANAQALKLASGSRDVYAQNQCGQGIICGACLQPRRGFCSPAGMCEDLYDTGGASCFVNDKVYSHGATGIKDPFSCNSCACNDGSLDCTEIGCETPCPPDAIAGKRCVQCGFAGGCDVVETGCLPVCSDTCPSPGQSCVDGVCSMLCE